MQLSPAHPPQLEKAQPDQRSSTDPDSNIFHVGMQIVLLFRLSSLGWCVCSVQRQYPQAGIVALPSIALSKSLVMMINRPSNLETNRVTVSHIYALVEIASIGTNRLNIGRQFISAQPTADASRMTRSNAADASCSCSSGASIMKASCTGAPDFEPAPLGENAGDVAIFRSRRLDRKVPDRTWVDIAGTLCMVQPNGVLISSFRPAWSSTLLGIIFERVKAGAGRPGQNLSGFR